MLQNRYGDTEYPIRDRWSSARIYRQALLRARPTWSAVRNLIWMSPALILLAALFIGTSGFSTVPNGDALGVLVLVEIGGFAVLIALGLIAATWFDRRRPRLEQQRYVQLTGASPITERQQQLLALDAQSDYAIGGWNSSLDYGPAWSQLPPDWQRRHDRDAAWHPFLTLAMPETEELRAKLDADWHIASSYDLELFVADGLSEKSLSTAFTTVLAGDQGERMLARVASLTGVNHWDLRALTEQHGERPPTLLWGADTQRMISVIRIGYLAGHLEADVAWQLVERAAAPAMLLFDSWESYWVNVRVGLAFWTDRLDAIQAFDHALAGLRTSNWPATLVPFPTIRAAGSGQSAPREQRPSAPTHDA